MPQTRSRSVVVGPSSGIASSSGAEPRDDFLAEAEERVDRTEARAAGMV